MARTDSPTLANSADVAAVAKIAAQRGRLGIDTEFMSEGRYRPLLCLTQVAVEDPDGPDGIRTILIDGLQNVAITPLAALLADPAVEIILHAGRQDIAILKREWGVNPVNIFDTQIVAGFAGESAQSGYGNLIGSVLGQRLAKTASYTRWDVRPLTAEQLSTRPRTSSTCSRSPTSCALVCVDPTVSTGRSRSVGGSSRHR